MAAEKLTRGRLAQILLMMLMLVSAFIWRSITSPIAEIVCYQKQSCQFLFDKTTVTLRWHPESAVYSISASQAKNLSIDIEKNGSYELKAVDDSWLLIPVVNPAEIKLLFSDVVTDKTITIKLK